MLRFAVLPNQVPGFHAHHQGIVYHGRERFNIAVIASMNGLFQHLFEGDVPRPCEGVLPPQPLANVAIDEHPSIVMEQRIVALAILG